MDLRPNKPTPYSTNLHRKLSALPSDELERIDTSPPVVTYNGPKAKRDSSALMTLISQHLISDDLVLDLGCGPKDQAEPVKSLGYQYVGIDYSNHCADFLADAHAIPFKNDTFACVLSYAVLEHLHNPIIAISEINRVLKSGGIYVGTVSLGEPFHDSYFHHTPWGIISLISSVPEFRILRMWSSGDTLGSLARMGRYPRILKWAIGLIDKANRYMPWLAPRRMKWSNKARSVDELFRAGSLCFLVKKL
jgi:SAM-dependent methyltransferase